MRYEFVDEEVEVSLDETRPGKPPRRFVWRGDKYDIEAIEATWVDKSFGPLQHGPRRWWQRRHRIYYQVSAAGCIYEIYHDRGLGSWTLLRRLVPDESE